VALRDFEARIGLGAVRSEVSIRDETRFRDEARRGHHARRVLKAKWGNGSR
jgi:hypothetical protein